MSYLRDKDEKCYILCKLQSRLFERSVEEGIPSMYFFKVFFNSKYCQMLDDLSYFNFDITDDEIFNYVKSNVHMKRGTILPEYVMGWIGYLLREWAYVYNLRSKQITRKVPLSYLSSVYNPYHSLDVQKAIQLIVEDKKLDINDDPQIRLMRILRKTYFNL